MKAKTLILATLLLSSTLTAEQTNIKQEGIGYIKMLGSTLKTQLKSQMQSDKSGLSAMGFCSSSADTITDEVNKKLPANAKVRRIALKSRNEANQPDALDQKVMNEYQASIEAKTFLPSDIKVVVDGDTTRVYKPLITKGVCLKCHGTNMSKEIQSQIDTHYPKDKAFGFVEGSLRGVIVAEIKK